MGISGGRGKISSVKVAREQKMMQSTLLTVEKLSREVNQFASENKKLQDELRLLQSQVHKPHNHQQKSRIMILWKARHGLGEILFILWTD